MQIVGLDNVAARYGIKTHLPMPLELLIADPPDLLLVGDMPTARRHPGLPHRATSRAAPAAFGATRFSGALHVLLRSDDRRRSRGARCGARLARGDLAGEGRAMTTHRWIMPTLVTIVLLLTIASIAVGRIVLDWNVWLDQDVIGRTILLELRLPRALLGIVIGAALGLVAARRCKAICAIRSPTPARSAFLRWQRSARC